MEKKITQRIIGVMVVGSLVVIALPLFFGKSDAPDEVVSVIPPATTQVAVPQTTPSIATATSQMAPVPAAQDIITEVTTPPITTPVPATVATTTSAAVNATTPVHTAVATSKSTTIKQQPPVASDPGSIDLTPQIINAVQNNTPTKDGPVTLNKVTPKTKVVPQKTKLPHLKTTLKLHQAAWVVQMGSFKNKDNAKHLTNRLRAAGFKAFMHTVKNGNLERVRVFIGPEYKHTSAAHLSHRVNHSINMQGIVIPYKPLAL
jgi:DedD protein